MELRHAAGCTFNTSFHSCKKWASWVGLTMPGKWAPPLCIRSATSAYLCNFSTCVSGFTFWLGGFILLNPAVDTGKASARAGSHGSPNRVPLVRNSWARYPARSWLFEAGFDSFGEAGLGIVGLANLFGLGIGGVSLSLRLLDAPGVSTRRAWFMVIVLMARLTHATSAPIASKIPFLEKGFKKTNNLRQRVKFQKGKG